MSQPNAAQICPVCKAGITVESLRPIYSGSSDSDPRKKAKDIPKRPQAERMEAPNNNGNGFGFGQGFNFSFGFMGFGFPGFAFGWVLNKLIVEQYAR